MKKESIFKIILLVFFLCFLGLYYSSQAGLVDYQAKNKNQLTEEQIKLFEEDLKNNVNIDLKDYITNKEEKYDNNISKTTLKVSSTIGETVDGALKFFFKKIDKMINE